MDNQDFNTQSMTATICDNAKLYGAKAPEKGELDTRAEVPEKNLTGFFLETMHGVNEHLENTTGEEVANSILWNLVNVIHRITCDLDRKDDYLQRELNAEIKCNDGSEIHDWKMQELLNDRENVNNLEEQFANIRNILKAEFYSLTGNAWNHAKGNVYSKDKKQTGSIFFADKLRKEQLLTKKQNARIGDIIVFASCPNAREESILKIFSTLDKTFEKYPNMSLITFGGNYASDKTAHNWAEMKGVSVIKYIPNFKKHGKSSPFKRNEQILKDFPDIVGIISTDSNGLVKNFVEIAKRTTTMII